MKKNILALALLFCLTFTATIFSAKAFTPPPALQDAIGTATSNLDFTALKSKILNGIDNFLKILNEIETKIMNNGYVSDASKQEIQIAFDQIEKQMSAYKAQVEAATSLEELQKLNQEIKNYILENKDVIKQSIEKAITEIAIQIKDAAQELEKTIKTILTTLKATCPQQKDAIAELENQLAALETEITALNAAIQAQNTAAMKQEVSKITTLSQEIATNVKSIQAACLSK